MTALIPPAAQAAVPSRSGTQGHAARAAATTNDNWPEFHGAPGLQGYAPTGTVTTANAAKLGVAWASDLYGAALDSPAVAYNTTLKETLAYVGTEQGDFLAINTANGQTVWSDWLGPSIRSSPLVNGGSVYVATIDSSSVYRLNAATGAVQCSVASARTIESSPVVATPPGGVTTLYYGSEDSAKLAGPTFAVNAATCAIEWQFDGFTNTTGAWDPISYTVDASGEPLVLFGTADQDAGVYAVDAITGQQVWRFQAANPPPSVYDIGAGVTISPPGAITADGVAFVPSKYGIMYALDLSTGAQIWSYNFDKTTGAKLSTSLSTAALDGSNLVFGDGIGLIDLNPTTGALIWSYTDPAGAEVLSSPAISGPAGSEMVVAGDVSGGVEAVSLATGAQLFHYQTGGYITGSPAIRNGDILIPSSDGFLYDFAVGKATSATAPTTTITSPADSSTVANPNGDLTVTGAATTSSTTSVANVEVAVQSGGPEGQWWDAASGTWNSGPIGNPATVTSPGRAASGWTFSYPVPPDGGTYQVTAYTVSHAGASDIKGADADFAVLATTTGAHLAASPSDAAPGSAVSVSGAGFGSSVKVSIALAGTTLGTATTTAAGALPASTSVKIPAAASFGQESLTATAGTTGPSALAAITVTNNWDELGYNAEHQSTEPNDRTFFNMITPGGRAFLGTSWQYQTGAAVETAPAVADDVAYIGNNAGQLAAVDVHNGAPLWTWALPSGAAIGGSPAVDPQQGLVLAGADDGTLDAVSTTTGKLAWSANAAGSTAAVSAPVYGGGDVYVTANTTSGATTTSTVAAYAEATGTPLWSVTGLAGPLTAPALDTTTKTLAVGGPTGITALNTVTGATAWKFAAGAVSAPPAIDAGGVYFGSADGNVYDVSEAAGTKTWSYQTSAPVTDTPALTSADTPGNVLTVEVGSGNGTGYLLNAASGSLDYSTALGSSPIVGVAAVNEVVVATALNGTVYAFRTADAENVVWQQSVTPAGITTPPAVVDGTVYVGARDGNLDAYSPSGHSPA